jgi:hypothetical protein
VAGVGQILAHVGQEVLVTRQYSNLPVRFVDKSINSWDHGLSQIAHQRTGSAEAFRDGAQSRQNYLGVLGGDFPGVQDPSPPAGQCHQQRPPAVLAGGIDVQGVSALTGEGLTDVACVALV